ncbi:DNA replication regulator DPB11 [Nakaseomyces bracarensis]|uniref:DNA replication regulator DPB11 n=1 Tax=Nakaseomyces bracarensis TaxID=273131 RepID=A0ABR4NUZ5_9SACH
MRPFARITFCCTGLDEPLFKSISKKILKLGGLLSYDLTSQVNVLIVGDVQRRTDKYEFAVRNRADMVFLDCNAVLELYHLWLAGEDITYDSKGKDHSMSGVSGDQPTRMLDLLRRRHTLAPMTDYVVFIGRINNSDEANVKELEELCSHMNCCKCISKHFMSDAKRKFAGKQVVFITDEPHGVRVEAARKDGIPVIHQKWLLDCYKRNATLQYDPYYLLEFAVHIEDFKEIGRDSCDCWDDLDNFNVITNNSRLIPEEDEEEVLRKKSVSKRLKPHGDKLWQKVMNKDAPGTSNHLSTSALENDIPIIKEEEDRFDSNAIFTGIKFQVHKSFKEEHSMILRKVILQNGGDTVEESESSRCILVLPSSKPLDELNEMIDEQKHTVVTEFFIERCLHYKKLLLPIDCWSSPFMATNNFKILCNRKSNKLGDPFVVSITGFSGVELLHLVKMLKALEPMGIKYSEYLDKSTDLLLVNLAVLPSITKTHPLWNNYYMDLFNECAISQTHTNQVFRNSLKRKIQYIKEDHCIPMATPGFIVEIFKQSKKLVDGQAGEGIRILLNNIHWLVLAPRGKKADFEFKLVKKSTEEHCNIVDKAVLSSNTGKANTNTMSGNMSLKRTTSELLEKINIKTKQDSTNDIIKFKRVKVGNDIKTAARHYSDLDSINDDLRNSDHEKRIPNIIRTTSWGSVMSEDMNRSSINNELQHSNIPYANQENINQTQVTYGTISEELRKN